MTTKHAGLPVPSDIWLTDQLAGWLAQLEQFFTEQSAATERQCSVPLEQLNEEMRAASLRKTVLLCTARQLVGEVLARG